MKPWPPPPAATRRHPPRPGGPKSPLKMKGASLSRRHQQTTLYRLVQQHATSFMAHIEASTGSKLPRFIKEAFDAFIDAASWRTRACGCAAAHLVDHAIPHVPLREGALSLPSRCG